LHERTELHVLEDSGNNPCMQLHQGEHEVRVHQLRFKDEVKDHVDR